MGDTSPILIIGLGNPILTDDAVGWRVVQTLRESLSSESGRPLAVSVEITEACVGGLSLAEMMVGYQRAIVIDAIMTRGGVPGTVYQLKLSNLPGTLNTASAHDTNLITALETLRRFDAIVPANNSIEVVAIEAENVLTFSEVCTPAVEASIPSVVELIRRLLIENSK